MRYLLVTGGVISGLGKGITASSLGVLLQTHGCKVTAVKIDPYLNQDSGTIGPFEHGECFVLADGGEADLDLGSYERFLGIKLSKNHNINTGKIYRRVLEAERRGEYLGSTVQIVPHVTDCIINWLKEVTVNDSADVCIIELGGTVGDIESLPFLEALRQMIQDPQDIFCQVHVSYLPVLKTTCELKTKPTQETVQNVRRYGLSPDFLCLRCEEYIPENIIAKVSKFCGVRKQRILTNVDVSNIYNVPLTFAGCISELWSALRLVGNPQATMRWGQWNILAHTFEQPFPELTIGIVGKYTGLRDSYLSLSHALKHAAMQLQQRVNIVYLDSETFSTSQLEQCLGIIIPGGFGQRGIEGMIGAAKTSRCKGLPTLGICLGMQVMVIEWTRNVLQRLTANSTEFQANTSDPVLTTAIDAGISDLGGTMRLGEQQVTVIAGSKVASVYQTTPITERHRHRYEVNPKYISELQNSGLKIAGVDSSSQRVEIIEDPESKWYVGCQFHPEYQTYPHQAHPLFLGFIKACVERINETST
jgi:CTP synthase